MTNERLISIPNQTNAPKEPRHDILIARASFHAVDQRGAREVVGIRGRIVVKAARDNRRRALCLACRSRIGEGRRIVGTLYDEGCEVVGEERLHDALQLGGNLDQVSQTAADAVLLATIGKGCNKLALVLVGTVECLKRPQVRLGRGQGAP